MRFGCYERGLPKSAGEMSWRGELSRCGILLIENVCVAKLSLKPLWGMLHIHGLQAIIVAIEVVDRTLLFPVQLVNLW